jgi:hypothetical protein
LVYFVPVVLWDLLYYVTKESCQCAVRFRAPLQCAEW